MKSVLEVGHSERAGEKRTENLDADGSALRFLLFFFLFKISIVCLACSVMEEKRIRGEAGQRTHSRYPLFTVFGWECQIN